MRLNPHLPPSVRRGIARALALLSALAAGLVLGGGFVEAHDVRLDEAVAALQKAAALVEASSAEGLSRQTQNAFDRHVDRALADIQNAMGHVSAAMAAADAVAASQ